MEAIKIGRAEAAFVFARSTHESTAMMVVLLLTVVMPATRPEIITISGGKYRFVPRLDRLSPPSRSPSHSLSLSFSLTLSLSRDSTS